MTRKLLVVYLGLSLLVGACTAAFPGGELEDNSGGSVTVYKDPT
jgi:hypothetical protein